MTYLLTFAASFLGCMAAYGVNYMIERYRIKQIKKRIEACKNELDNNWLKFMSEVERHNNPDNNIVNLNLYKAMKDEE